MVYVSADDARWITSPDGTVHASIRLGE
jgi:hypothetical protein